MHNLPDLIQTFIGLLVIVNPLVAVPIFVSLTNNCNEKEKLSTARLSALTVALVLGVTAVAGQAILHTFGISIAAFRVAGGILILLMAISMLHAKVGNTRHTEEEANEAESKDQVGVVPLGIPLMAGPGAISTVIIYAHRSQEWAWSGILLGEIAIIALLVWTTLYLAEHLSKWLGMTGLNIASRIMGLLLAAISIGFITEGLKALLPGLA